jgi:hypothetical protein
MMVIEMREAAQEKAFDLIDEMKDLGRQKKMIMCELEDTLYDCFEYSKEDKEPEEEATDEGTDLGFKKGMYNRHYAMRNFDKPYDDEDEMMEHQMRQYRRNRAMRMRRNRMGRFA